MIKIRVIPRNLPSGTNRNRIILAIHYCPNVNIEFDRVRHICRDVNYLWFLRKLHANGVSLNTNFSWSVNFNIDWVFYIKRSVAKDRCTPIDGSVQMCHLCTDTRDTAIKTRRTSTNRRWQFIDGSFTIALKQNTVHAHRLILQLVQRILSYKRIRHTIPCKR